MRFFSGNFTSQLFECKMKKLMLEAANSKIGVLITTLQTMASRIAVSGWGTFQRAFVALCFIQLWRVLLINLLHL